NQPLSLANLINGRKAKEDHFKNYDPDSKNLLPVIYQSGYLTIKDFDEESGYYTLDFPNKEIQEGFIEGVLSKFVSVPDDDLGLAIENLREALVARNIDKALSIIQSAIADLPTIVKKDMCENYYESVTHLIFRLTGWRVVSELQSVAGRSDVVVATKDTVYIFELKMDRGRPFDEVADEGLSQIDANGYSDRFKVSGKEMIKAALVFSSEGKGLVGWKTTSLN
ncbi:MAG: PD-(D/E)XK nuclease domain-containing protein, partial [Treponema sp.]|nr:PD-(D/E)XK nuclease domain-containing protein [Treponema sp.]